MIDINNVLDLVKLKFYNEWIYTQISQDSNESDFNKAVTETIVEKYVEPLNLDKQKLILDMGCGSGYFLDGMKSRGYNNILGITLSEGDIKLCTDKGHTIRKYDMTCVPQKDGFYDETVDFIFARHVLHQSPYPIFTLIEFNRLLKPGSYIYIELPSQESEHKSEYDLGSYSVLSPNQLHSLLTKTGFRIEKFEQIDFKYDVAGKNGEKTERVEKYHCITAKKLQTLDIK